MITRELIAERVETIKKDLVEAQRQLVQMTQLTQALIGALQDCNYWLSLLDKEGTTQEEPKAGDGK